MYEITESQIWGIVLACVMMCADVLTGFIVAVINNDVSSTKMRKGLLHKVLTLVLMFVCLAIEIGVSHMTVLPFDIPTCEVVSGYVVVMELASVLENIGRGYPEFADSTLFRLFNLGKDEDDAQGD